MLDSQKKLDTIWSVAFFIFAVIKMNTLMKRHDYKFCFFQLCCMMSNMAFGHDFELKLIFR